MTHILHRRMERLESPPGDAGHGNLAERLETARRLWRDEPEDARQASAGRRMAFLASCAASAAEGRKLEPLALRIMNAYRRTEATR